MQIKIRSPFSFEERLKIENSLRQGFTSAHTGRLIERSKNAVAWEIRRNGGRKKYNAIEAQKNADNRNKTRIQKIAITNSLRHPENNLKKRIENIEMQIEILAETLKELIHATKN